MLAIANIFVSYYLFLSAERLFSSRSSSLSLLDRLFDQSQTLVVLITVSFQTLLNTLIKKLAQITTRWENHKTLLSFESAYISKAYLLTLTNLLTPLLLIAFYVPVHHPEVCMDQNHCYLDLQFYFRGVVLLRCLYTLLYLLCCSFYRRMVLRVRLYLMNKQQPNTSAWHSRHLAYLTLNRLVLSQYLRMDPSSSPDLDHLVFHYYYFAFNFAIILSFGACMPSAMFLLLLCQLVFLKVLRHDLLMVLRREVPRLAYSIGEWIRLMDVVSLLAIPLNAMYLTHSLSYFSSLHSDLLFIKTYRMQFFGLFCVSLFLLKTGFGLLARERGVYALFARRALHLATTTRPAPSTQLARGFALYNLLGTAPE